MLLQNKDMILLILLNPVTNFCQQSLVSIKCVQFKTSTDGVSSGMHGSLVAVFGLGGIGFGIGAAS